MNEKITAVLDSILAAFENGTVPEAIAIATFPPITGIPSQNWSFNNKIIQFLAGTFDSRGYRMWQEVNRNVKKGAKSTYILVPLFKKIVDEGTEEEKQILTSFKPCPVFRVEDTEGAPLDYQQNIELPQYPLLNRAKELGVSVKGLPGNSRYYGYYSPDRKQIGLCTKEESVFFHELSHLAHEKVIGRLKPGQHVDQEVVAELSAVALCRIVGKSPDKTFGNSFCYIRRYAEKINLSPHQACLKVLSDTEKVLKLILHGEAEGVAVSHQQNAA